jgi:hypothetical protein
MILKKGGITPPLRQNMSFAKQHEKSGKLPVCNGAVIGISALGLSLLGSLGDQVDIFAEQELAVTFFAGDLMQDAQGLEIINELGRALAALS